MNRNAGSLIVSSVLTSVFGFAFWILAARTMSAADVGTGSAVVAALVLLGNMSTLGLRNALPGSSRHALQHGAGHRVELRGMRRDRAGRRQRLRRRSPMVGGRAHEAAAMTSAPRRLFVVAVAVWAVFILQDNVLVGLRTATWVPVENLAYAVAKLGGLVMIAVDRELGDPDRVDHPGACRCSSR